MKKPLIVTTTHKGVFFGYAEVTENKIIRLEKAQMCVYWSSDVKGVLGLAASGPTSSCKVGPPVPAITLHDITSIMEVSEVAETKWTTFIWK